MIRGEPSGWRCARWPQSMLGSAPGGSVKLSTASSPASTSSSIPASALASPSPASTLFAVVGLVDTGRLDVVFLHQLAEVLAIDIGGARGVRDVARVAPQQLQDVVALERGDPALLGVLEGDAFGEQLVGRRRRR